MMVDENGCHWQTGRKLIAKLIAPPLTFWWSHVSLQCCEGGMLMVTMKMTKIMMPQDNHPGSAVLRSRLQMINDDNIIQLMPGLRT